MKQKIEGGKKAIVIRCKNVEDGYGFQVMVDQMVAEGLYPKQAIKIARTWIKQPSCDRGIIERL